MPEFRSRKDHQLDDLTDEEILAYALAARAAGALDHCTRALQILAFGYLDILHVRIAKKVPREQVEDVAGAAILRAIASLLKEGAFKGSSPGEFRAYLHTIVDRQVVDFFRARERRPEEAPLPEEHEGEEDFWRAAGMSPDELGAVEVQELIDKALDELNELHRHVVELYVFDKWGAEETADRIGEEMTAANVHKIAQRFRDRMRELLEAE